MEDEPIEIEIIHFTADGKGVGWGPKGEVVIADGCNPNDQVIKVKITHKMQEVLYGIKKGSAMLAPTEEEEDEGPYSLDDDEEDYEDED